MDGVTAGRRPGHAEQAVAGGAPSGFSRIQIAWCAGCWPTSPRPPRVPPALPYHRRPPVNGRAKGPVLPRPAAGDRQPAKILIRSSFSTPMMALACLTAEPWAAMTAGRRSHRAERSPATSLWVSWPSRAVLRALHSGGSPTFRHRHSGPGRAAQADGPAARRRGVQRRGCEVRPHLVDDETTPPPAGSSQPGGHQRPWPGRRHARPAQRPAR